MSASGVWIYPTVEIDEYLGSWRRLRLLTCALFDSVDKHADRPSALSMFRWAATSRAEAATFTPGPKGQLVCIGLESFCDYLNLPRWRMHEFKMSAVNFGYTDSLRDPRAQTFWRLIDRNLIQAGQISEVDLYAVTAASIAIDCANYAHVGAAAEAFDVVAKQLLWEQP